MVKWRWPDVVVACDGWAQVSGVVVGRDNRMRWLVTCGWVRWSGLSTGCGGWVFQVREMAAAVAVARTYSQVAILTARWRRGSGQPRADRVTARRGSTR